ncbi:hypothetical protein A9Q84_14985 [Halobacteriovorax marinus]|uniref:Metallo-beta-lactamase domain-containing protein n=1 Tax=Halobacteriovorax marinus TaxID=97084 RepID=A0A1Y5FAZ3_9BACT|nr:hypothetical protein A9Q84_14985 [Halobacteriovorax marinus]
MKITQVRNATIIIEYKENHILVDPMFANKGELPRWRYIGSNQRNPLVDLPQNFASLSDSVTHALITHCQKGHADHLDTRGKKFLRDKEIPIFSTFHDEKYLKKKGLKVTPLKKEGDQFFDGEIQQVQARHVKGFLTPFMEHGVGYYITLPKQPSVYLMGDTILTDTIRDFIKEKQPDYIVAPTGVAKFDIGSPLLLPPEDILELFKISKGKIIANHMDALDHCRMSREDLTKLLSENDLMNRVVIPNDGESVHLEIN